MAHTSAHDVPVVPEDGDRLLDHHARVDVRPWDDWPCGPVRDPLDSRSRVGVSACGSRRRACRASYVTHRVEHLRLVSCDEFVQAVHALINGHLTSSSPTASITVNSIMSAHIPTANIRQPEERDKDA